MKKKITSSLVLMIVIGITITSLLFINIFYGIDIRRERSNIINLADTLEELVLDLETEEDIKDRILKFNRENGKFNIFYISRTGEVYNESNISREILDKNVINDILNNKKNITKFEDKLGENYFIEAREIEDGFLVLSKLSESPFKSIKNIIPSIITLIIIGYFIALFISERTVDDFVNTIENQARDARDEDYEIDIKYQELYPFIRIIKDQNENIRNNIDEIKSQTETLDAIISNMTEGMILLDKNMNILSINNAAIKLGDIGYPGMQIDGVNLKGLFRDENMNDRLNDILENPLKSYNFDINIQNRILNVLVNPVVNNSRHIGFVIFLVDETKQKQLEMQRSEFSANVSHELKTPLTSINGYAEMMKAGIVKPEDVKKFGGIIFDEGQNLLNMIDDIIKISRLDESYDELELEEVNISLLIENILTTLRTKIKEKSIDVSYEANIDKTYRFNKQLLKELLLNLIDNGIKYNKTGGSLSIKIDEVEDKYLQFIVEDTGIGIAEEEQSRIFERFYTIDKSHNKKDSSGLGLSIVKHIIRILNGNLQLESKPNLGTKFTIKLPINGRDIN